MTRDDAGKLLRNPVPITRQSVENGRRLFEIYCAHCHGPTGKGMGIVSTKFIPAPDLTLPLFKERTDGFIYGQIRTGGPLMPPHGEVLSAAERWDLVNFLRSLQGLWPK
jgi:mono/diheme cytochrome c family protein